MIPLIECVPNISEGRDINKINAIAHVVETVDGVQLLEIDAGPGANRSVITFVGPPQQVVEAAFRLIKKASEVIDMRLQTGAHPRIGATDVCPLIPISGITTEELIPFAHQLGERVGRELNIPGYFYEEAATRSERKNLAFCRKGEYEGLQKLSTPDGHPDFGPAEFNDHVKKTGATVIGVRDFLIAYNVNLNTTSVELAKEIACEVRESGRIKRGTDSITGEMESDEKPIRIPGSLKSVKGIGWFIEEYGIAQVSLNITNIAVTPVHIAFEEVRKKALEKGLRVTGSELVGLIPLKCLIDAADFYLSKQGLSTNISEDEKVKIAIKSLGLDDLAPFIPEKKVLEYVMRQKSNKAFIDLSLYAFAEKISSKSYLPAGGSASAYCGALGIALGAMSANVSAHKKNWEDKREFFLPLAARAIEIRDKLLQWVDRDSMVYQKMMDALAMPKTTEEEEKNRSEAIAATAKDAVRAPLEIAEISLEAYDILTQVVKNGNKASITDAAVGTTLIAATIKSAILNVKINVKYVEDKKFKEETLLKLKKMEETSINRENEIISITHRRLET